MKSLRAIGCAGLICGSVLLGSFERAQGADVAAPAVNAVLTDESLAKLLDQMGYSPKKLKQGYLISIQRDTWTINIQLTLSPDGTKVGLNSNLGLVENVEDVTREQWMGLLMANQKIDPSAFYFDAEAKKLYLHRTIDNRALDAAILRKQIDAFCGTLISTSDLWKFTK